MIYQNYLIGSRTANTRYDVSYPGDAILRVIREQFWAVNLVPCNKLEHFFDRFYG